MWAIRVLPLVVCLAVLAMGLPAEAKDKSGVLKATDLLGMKVEGTDGKKLGDIKDLVVDPEDGSIDYVVLDYGGIAGIGDKYFAVPWNAFDFGPGNKKLLLQATKKDLKDAPGFDKKNWPDFTDQRQVVTIYEFYEVPMSEARSLKDERKPQ